MKVVLDTNVIISALFWTGKTSKILDLIKNKKITIYACPEQIIELKDVLNRPKFRPIFQKTGLNPEMLVIEFFNLAKLVKPVRVLNIIKEDPFG